MKKLQYIITLFLLQFVLIENLSATHIIGGEVNYKCLGSNKYEITLIVYRDCFNGVPPFDDPAQFGIFDKDYNLIDSLELKLNPDDTLKAILNDTCLVVPKNVCVHTTIYKDTVELLPRPGGYIIGYQRCCRNNTIINIIDPQDTGASFVAFISEKALTECNNSAKFKNWPPIFICVNEQIKFDHSAIDIDNDSIYYRLCTPFKGATDTDPIPLASEFTVPFDTLQWKTGYSLQNILGGIPLTINPKTGELTGKPNAIGQFVVGICSEEYRKGILISTNRRDFQYNIGVCGSADASIFAPKTQCDDLKVEFKNFSKNADKFLWDFGDLKTLVDTSILEEPFYTYPDTGTYKIRLIASPNSACADTSFHIIKLSKSNLTPDFTFTTGKCLDSLDIVFQDKSIDPTGAVSNWSWKMYNGNDTIKSNLQNPTLKPWKSGTWTTELTVTAKNGCPKIIQKPVVTELINISVLDTVSACIGEDVALLASGPSQYTYSWSPPSDFTNPTQAVQTAEVAPLPKTYTLEITSATCKSTKKITVIPDPSTPKLIVTATPDTIFLGKTSQLDATVYPSNYKYLWSPTGTLSSDKQANPIASPTETTTYSVTLTPPGGACPAVAEARVFVFFPDCAEPYIFVPNAFSPNEDNVNDVLYVRGPVKELHFVVYNRWGEKMFETFDVTTGWDGYLATTPLPPDVYGYYLEVVCFDDKKFFKKGNVSLIR